MSLYVDSWKEEFLTKLEKLDYELINVLSGQRDLYEKNIMTNTDTYNKLVGLYKLFHILYDDINGGKLLNPDEVKRILSDILGYSEQIDQFVELYRLAYDDLWTNGMYDVLRTIAYDVAEALKLALTDQLGLVLKVAVRNYLQQNPGSRQYVIGKLNELIDAIDNGSDVRFKEILNELGVPNEISNLLTDMWYDLSGFYNNYFSDINTVEMDHWMIENIEEVIKRLNQI